MEEVNSYPIPAFGLSPESSSSCLSSLKSQDPSLVFILPPSVRRGNWETEQHEGT